VLEKYVSRSVGVAIRSHTTLPALEHLTGAQCVVLPAAAAARFRREVFGYNFHARPRLLALGDETLLKCVMRPRQHGSRCLSADFALPLAHHETRLELGQQNRLVRRAEFLGDVIVQLFHQVANALQQAPACLFEVLSLFCPARLLRPARLQIIIVVRQPFDALVVALAILFAHALRTVGGLKRPVTWIECSEFVWLGGVGDWFRHGHHEKVLAVALSHQFTVVFDLWQWFGTLHGVLDKTAVEKLALFAEIFCAHVNGLRATCFRAKLDLKVCNVPAALERKRRIQRFEIVAHRVTAHLVGNFQKVQVIL